MKCTKTLGMFNCVCFTFLSIATDLVTGVPDYQQNNNVVGWIKLHKSPATFKDAYLTCYDEGAILASPINEVLADSLDEKRKITDSSFWIGTHSLFSEGDFLSVEGVPLTEMPISVSYGSEPDENCVILTASRQATTTNCTRLLPYMCYRNRREQPVNYECGTFDNKYKLEPRTGSCYKLHEEHQDWSRAHSICTAEGGYLAVINNEEEANILKNMSSQRPLKISKFNEWEPMFIGIRDWYKTGTWITVQGDTIKNVYHVWGWGQPDNLNNEQYCGSLLKTGKLDDTWCNIKAMFMCEKDPVKGRFEYPIAINLTEPEADSNYFTVNPESAASI